MAVIVSDTTPLNYLVLIEAIDLLPGIYRRVLIPPAVWVELAQPRTPEPVLKWLPDPPHGWKSRSRCWFPIARCLIWTMAKRKPSL